MASFLGLEKIWVYVKKLPILFFAASFISFEPKLKMAAVAASISSMSLFSPYAFARPKTHNPQPHKPSNSNSKRKQLLRNPSAPPPTHRWQRDTAPPHTLLKVRRPPTLQRSSTPHSDASPKSFLPFLLFFHLRPLWDLHVPNPPRQNSPSHRWSHTHLQHLQSVTSEDNLWVWVLICGGGAWLI